jgi:hypothetical protein
MSPRSVVFIALAMMAMHLTGCGAQVPGPQSDDLRAEPTVETGTRLPEGLNEDVRFALSRCWSIDPNMPPVVITIHATVRRDGTVSSATIADQDRYSADPSFRDAADRARRAVLNPHCQPLPFPDDLWPSWRELVLTFDPRPRPEGP